MSTSQPTSPPDGTRIIRDALAALEVSADLKQDFFAGVAAADILISDPIATYAVGLNDVKAGKLTAAATLTHWRYLLATSLPARPLAIADLGQLNNTWVLAGINRGDVASATATAVAFAQTTPEWKSGSFELRTLQVPALYTVLVWLHGAIDRFVPITDPEQALRPGTTIDEATVLKVLGDFSNNYQPVQA
jgi:hypothetical protein